MESIEIALLSGKLIIIDVTRLEEIYKLRGFLTDSEFGQVTDGVRKYLERQQ